MPKVARRIAELRPPREERAEPGCRILHVVAPASFGGVERVVQGLSIGSHRLGYDVHVATVVSPRRDHGAFAAPLREAGIEVHAIPVGRRAYLQEYRAVARLCTELAPDVVHTHGYRSDIVAGRAARHAGFPTVTTIHGFARGDWKLRVYERIQRHSLGQFDAVIPVSRSLADELAAAGVPRDRIHLIPNTWVETHAPLNRAPARRALGQPLEGSVIGWVGRLSREKGPDLVIDALRYLNGGTVTLVLIGDGPARPALQQRAAALGVASRIRWCGPVPDAGQLFAAFDVFVFSSRTAGTPLVLFEAMAARTPIVATSVGGVSEILPAGTAWLVRPDDPVALAQALREVLSHPRHAAARASAARTRLLTRYDPQSWLEAYQGIYQGVRRTAGVGARS